VIPTNIIKRVPAVTTGLQPHL